MPSWHVAYTYSPIPSSQPVTPERVVLNGMGHCQATWPETPSMAMSTPGTRINASFIVLPRY